MRLALKWKIKLSTSGSDKLDCRCIVKNGEQCSPLQGTEVARRLTNWNLWVYCEKYGRSMIAPTIYYMVRCWLNRNLNVGIKPSAAKSALSPSSALLPFVEAFSTFAFSESRPIESEEVSDGIFDAAFDVVKSSESCRPAGRIASQCCSPKHPGLIFRCNLLIARSSVNFKL